MKMIRHFASAVLAVSLLLTPWIEGSSHARNWTPTLNQTIFKGDCKRLVLLVETEDRPFYTQNANHEYDIMLNGENYTGLGCVGSAREFLIDNSGGKFRPQFIVVGPLRLSHSMGYYCGKPKDGEPADGDNGKLVMEACRLAKVQNPDIDFSEFDYNKDGKVDNVYLFHSGPNDPAYPTPWPHASGVGGGGLVIDGVLVDSYAISQEMASETVRGAYSTFLHEFGHTLGMPDDYSGRLGKFSIYCDGTFDGGVIPVNLNAGERLILGWLDYEEIDHDGEYTLEPLAKNKALMLKTNNPDEFFLFSNRSNRGDLTPWDAKFEYSGMLVWHVDRSRNKVRIKNDDGTFREMTAIGMWYNNSPNAGEKHPCHELVEADNIDDPHNYRAGMYFPGPRSQTELNSATHKEFRTWSGAPMSAEIYDIRQESDGNITFKVRNVDASSVTVNVRNSSGIVLRNTYVSLAQAEETTSSSGMRALKSIVTRSSLRYTAYTDSEGTCSFTGVKTGKYQLIVDNSEYVVSSRFVDIVEGENVYDITLQSPPAYNLTKLTWINETKGDPWNLFYVPDQVRGAQWDADDLAGHVGEKLSNVDVWLGGHNHITLWVFKDKVPIFKKDIPKEQVYDNGVTNIDISAENIFIEKGHSYQVGYQVMDDYHNGWPSTGVSPQTLGKGGLVYSINDDLWSSWNGNEDSNDMNIDFGVYIYLASDYVDKPVEKIAFDEPFIDLPVGESMELHVNVAPVDVVNRKVTWATSDESVVAVNPDGKITAVATGEAEIKATSVQNPSVTAVCKVRVTMNEGMIKVRAGQREAKVSWPGDNPDYRWVVKYRRAGEQEYSGVTTELSDTEVWIDGLEPETDYEAVVSLLADGHGSDVEFSFSTKALTSEYAALEISPSRPAVGDVVEITVLNVQENGCKTVFKVNGTEVKGHEYKVTESGTLVFCAEVTFKDGSVEKIIREADIKK